ncbi:MAG TPA: TRAP transporter small permease [Marinobacter sp.]|uniref:TRAP transporter small permease protein n=2 Tax=root TaxID=1 RepID=A0A831R6G3_9GAMM|nr:TRAP transporter small permease [Marinobacter antarcticus]HDZ37209.1 TRAP transporter small permease [Marinobacter sp.]HEA53862.1 TRAP transporter small permease [Marinobacter antarcticus]
MNYVLQPLRALVIVSAATGVAAYAAAALFTVGDVVGRQIGMPIPGVVDLVQLCVVGGAWLVIPYAFLTGAHVGVDLLVESFPRALETLLRTIAGLAAIALLTLMFHYCYETFQQKLMFGDRSQQLGIPIFYFWIPLLYGVALSIVAAALAIIPTPRLEASE